MRFFLLVVIMAIVFPTAVPPDANGASVCGSDLNSDGLINAADELILCVQSICPQGAVPCVSTYAEPKCKKNGILNLERDKCQTEKKKSCPAGYKWVDAPIAMCEASPQCDHGSYDPTANACFTGNDTCPLGNNYLCADINGSGVKVCSANACVDFTANPPEPSPAEPTGFQNDGTVDQATGECSGVFKIFNGKGGECLEPGWETTFFNCCDTDEGSWWFFQEVCPEQSKITAQALVASRAHYVGEYCRMDIWLIGCIQSADMYCIFNSKMARIIHEQGRSQLQKFGSGGGWGSAQAPNCEGFTPEEFQMLDFSKIDLSEIYGDITPLPAGQMRNGVQGVLDTFQDNVR